MENYIRFQTALRCPDTARPLGIFVAAGQVEESVYTDTLTREWLQNALDWFNKNLKVPRIDESQWRCVFWFRTEAQRFIAKIWELVAILREEGVPVHMHRTNAPGQIVYRDHFQIAAIRPRSRRRRATLR